MKNYNSNKKKVIIKITIVLKKLTIVIKKIIIVITIKIKSGVQLVKSCKKKKKKKIVTNIAVRDTCIRTKKLTKHLRSCGKYFEST